MEAQPAGRSSVVSWRTAACIYIPGLVLWAALLHFGRFELSFGDWAKELGSFTVIRQFLRGCIIPWHTEYGFQDTHRFLAVPEITWFPTILLLPIVGPAGFVLAHVATLYTIGFAGWLRLSRFLKLDAAVFACLVLIGSFNGYIVAHIAIGHTMWVGCYWLPWVFLFLLRLIRDPDDRLAIGGLALAFLGMLVTGSMHLWIQAQLFVLLVCIYTPRLWQPWLAFATLSLLLGAWRLLPAAITFAGMKDDFASGYPSVASLLRALAWREAPNAPPSWNFLSTIPVYWVEYTAYVGIGMVLIALGLFAGFTRRVNNLSSAPLAPGALLFGIFTYSVVWYFVWASPIPLLNSQRAPTRFIIFPVLVFAILGCEWWQTSRFAHRKWIPTALAVVLAVDLATNAWNWRVTNLAALLPKSWRYPMLSGKMPLLDWGEPRYRLVVLVSLCMSIVVAVSVAIALVVHRKRRRELGDSA